MKKVLTVFTLLFAGYSLSAQTLFQKSYSNGSLEKGTCVIKTSDGGYLEGGTMGSGLDDIYIVKTDYAGGVLWSKTYGGTVSEYLATVIQTNDGGYLLCGTTFSFNSQPYGDILLIKTDSVGNIVWQNHYGYTGYDYGYSVKQTADGGYIVGGLTSSFGAGYYDYFIMKITSAGSAQWGTTIGGAGNDEGYSVLQTADGGYMIAGQENSYSFTMINPYQIMLCKVSATGTVLWSKSYGGGNAGGNYICYSLKQTTDAGFIMVGWTDGVGAGNQDIFAVKVDSAGVPQWSKAYGGVNSDFGNDVVQTTNGGYAIAGSTKSFGAGNDDAYLIVTDGSGNIVFSICYGDTANDVAAALHQTADGGFIIAGRTAIALSGSSDFYLIKCDAAGSTGCRENDVTTIVTSPSTVETTISPLTSSNVLHTVAFATTGSGCTEITHCSTVGINENNVDAPSFTLYPNPVIDGFVNVHFNALNSVAEILEVENMLGETVISVQVSSDCKLDVSELAPGIYFVRRPDEEALKLIVR